MYDSRDQTGRPERQCLLEPEVKLTGHQQSPGRPTWTQRPRQIENLSFHILSLSCVTVRDPETHNPDSQLTLARARVMIKGPTLKRDMHNPVLHTRSHETRCKLQCARSRTNELVTRQGPIIVHVRETSRCACLCFHAT